jgi:hypothetical protein
MTLSTDIQTLSRYKAVTHLPLKVRNQANLGVYPLHIYVTVPLHICVTEGKKIDTDYQMVKPMVLKSM